MKTRAYTKKKDRQNKEKNYYNANARLRSQRCQTKTLLHLYIHLLNTTLHVLQKMTRVKLQMFGGQGYFILYKCNTVV